jgi:hypothetical protein
MVGVQLFQDTHFGASPTPLLSHNLFPPLLLTYIDFPWDMAKDVEHHVMWIRPQLVTPAAFKRREDDPPYPSREYRKINGLRVAALVEYLNKNNMYGWTGLPPSAVSPFRQSILLHPTKKHVWKSESGELITRQEATRAMRWVARHTESLIEMKFPPSSYETVWSRSSKRVQYVNSFLLCYQHLLSIIFIEVYSDARYKF